MRTDLPRVLWTLPRETRGFNFLLATHPLRRGARYVCFSAHLFRRLGCSRSVGIESARSLRDPRAPESDSLPSPPPNGVEAPGSAIVDGNIEGSPPVKQLGDPWQVSPARQSLHECAMLKELVQQKQRHSVRLGKWKNRRQRRRHVGTRFAPEPTLSSSVVIPPRPRFVVSKPPHPHHVPLSEAPAWGHTPPPELPGFLVLLALPDLVPQSPLPPERSHLREPFRRGSSPTHRIGLIPRKIPGSFLVGERRGALRAYF